MREQVRPQPSHPVLIYSANQHNRQAVTTNAGGTRSTMLVQVIAILLVLHSSSSQDIPCASSDEGRLRLQGGTSYAGMVEACTNTRRGDISFFWVTVCTIGFGQVQAAAVCRRLGFTNTSFTGKTILYHNS